MKKLLIAALALAAVAMHAGETGAARRELAADSMEIFPLHDDGKLYGVIENGEYRFHARHPGQAEHPAGIAKLTLLWLLDDGEWKLARALSFDHSGLD